MSTLKFAVAGASGRMGRMLIETILNTSDAKLVGALDMAGSSAIGQDPANFLGKDTGIKITADIKEGLKNADFLIDFTRPEGTLTHLAIAQEMGVKMIIGTTGFTDEQKAALKKASEKLAIVFAPNMSVGVNATFKLLEVAAKILNQGYDIEIVESHHKHKVDAPSGTAIGMGEVIAKALGKELKDCAVYAREGHTGVREDGTIGFATIRGGDIVGDHTVMFCGDGERIEVTHKSASRMSYAQGAVRAGRFLANQKAGLFDMQDVLGLKNLKI
jgi:4-hydroxy-tetrahydrodipicolinate reductase